MCKSKGGRTKHQRSKHADELGEGSSSSASTAVNWITADQTRTIIRDIGKYLTDEKLFQTKQIEEVFKLEPSAHFVSFLNDILDKWKRKKSKEKFLKEFYGSTNTHWQKYFHPYPDKKMVFLMLIHLPERLLLFVERNDSTMDKAEVQYHN